MKYILLTATHDQHLGFRISVRWVKRMVDRLPPDAEVIWIVVDDGADPVRPSGKMLELKEGVAEEAVLSWLREGEDDLQEIQLVYLRRTPAERGLESFKANFRELSVMAGEFADSDDLICVIEDDWYRPELLLDAFRLFQGHRGLALWGETQTRYYRVDNRAYLVFRPNGRSMLSGSVMRAGWGARRLREWADDPGASIMLDNALWRRSDLGDDQKLLLPESLYVVGIKGLPGAQGLGIGSSLGEKHGQDPDGAVLRQWVSPADAEVYLPFFRPEPTA